MVLEEAQRVLAILQQIEVHHLVERILHRLRQVQIIHQQEVIHLNQRIIDHHPVLILLDHTLLDHHHQDQAVAAVVRHQVEVVLEDNINGIIFNTETL